MSKNNMSVNISVLKTSIIVSLFLSLQVLQTKLICSLMNVPFNLIELLSNYKNCSYSVIHFEIIILSIELIVLLTILLILRITGTGKRFKGHHSKYYLHYSDLDFKTPINDKRIDNPNALSILMELNNNLIPNYLKYKEAYNRLTELKPLSDQDKQIKQNELIQTDNTLNDLKQQILSKTQQIKDILNREKEINIHKDFMNQYQDIKKITNKLTH